MVDTPDDAPHQSAEVIDFNTYRNRDLISTLESALEDARAGKLTGAIMVLQREWRNHGIVVVGDYERHPEKIIKLSGEIFIHFQTRSPERPTIID